MSNGLIAEFRWPVLSTGYQWVEAVETEVNDPDSEEGETGLFLVENPDVNAPSRLYSPLQEQTGLFRTFADLDGSPAAFLSFAEQFGTLGGIKTKIRIGEKLTWGESISAWTSETRNLGALIKLWHMVQEKDTAGLSEFIAWTAPSRVTPPKVVLRAELSNSNMKELVWGWKLSVARFRESLATDKEYPLLGVEAVKNEALQYIELASPSINPDVFMRFRREDVVQPARFLLAVLLDHEIREHAVSVGFSNRDFELRLTPSNLRGALWLQFAMAVNGNRSYRRCLDCNKWFEIEGHAGRSDKIYCSDSHRANAHRKKKDNAKNLAAEGVAPEEIARLTDTRLETVKGWIKS